MKASKNKYNDLASKWQFQWTPIIDRFCVRGCSYDLLYGDLDVLYGVVVILLEAMFWVQCADGWKICLGGAGIVWLLCRMARVRFSSRDKKCHWFLCLKFRQKVKLVAIYQVNITFPCDLRNSKNEISFEGIPHISWLLV